MLVTARGGKETEEAGTHGQRHAHRDSIPYIIANGHDFWSSPSVDNWVCC